MSRFESISKWPWLRRWFGSRSERAAASFLEAAGYRILAKNYSCRGGEIDLIAQDGQAIVFVEVRSTGGADATRPALSVGREKQSRLTELALRFLQERNLLGSAGRFDIIAIAWPGSGGAPRIVHYPNAFEPADRFQFFS